MRRNVRLFARVLLLSALGWWSLAVAQEAPAPAAPKKGPDAILAIDIPTRADADERFAQEVIQRSRGQDPTAGLQKRLDALAESVRREGQYFKRDEMRLLSVDRLESLERHWNFYARQLESWRRDLRNATSQYNEDAAELSRRRSIWEATRASPESSGLAPALANRLTSVLTQLELAEQVVSGPIEREVRLSRRANAVESSITAGQKAVAAAIAYNDARLLRLDAPPLWKLWGESQASGSALQSLEA